MSDPSEGMRSRKLKEDHQVAAEEGAKLQTAIADEAGVMGPGRGSDAGKWLRIRVTDIATGRSKASVQIPIALMDAGMRIGARFAPDVEGVDLRRMLEAIRSGATGRIIDVVHDADGEHVEIFVD